MERARLDPLHLVRTVRKHALLMLHLPFAIYLICSSARSARVRCACHDVAGLYSSLAGLVNFAENSMLMSRAA